MDQFITIHRSDDNIATLVLNNKEARVNIYSTPFMEALETAIDELRDSNSIRGLVIRSGKNAGFVAGANIDEIAKITEKSDAYEKSRRGQLLFQKIAQLPFPTVAAINGHCMGGGTEMVLACDYRLAAKDAADIALPEVKLGLFPGWGGTQRLPKLISLQKALDMILTGKSYNAYRALKAGLVDESVSDSILHEYAVDFTRNVIESGSKKYESQRKQKSGGFQNWLLEKNPIGRSILWNQAKKRVLSNTKGKYPAPLKALEIIKRTYKKNIDKGLELEAQGFSELTLTPEHKNLLHVYKLREYSKKPTGIPDDVEPRSIKKTGVLGAGVMGGGIAQLLAYNDFVVRMKDIDEQMVADGLKHAGSVFDKAVHRHKLSELQRDRKMELISGTTRYDGFETADVVIEAVVEKMNVKKQVLQEIEDHLPEEAVFASNTSALSITELQEEATHPERVGGMHFFNPVHRMPLVEVIKGKKTNEKTVATIFQLARDLNKNPIIVKDSPGFLVNRILGVYLNEACLLADEGYDYQWVDSQIEDFGMPMGPFRLIDEVGIDIAAEVADTLAETFSEYLEESPLLRKVNEKGLKGKKSGSGFYTYEDGETQETNNEVRQLANGTQKGDPEYVTQRIIYLMVNEAARCLQENIVESPKDVDVGLVFGTGFPPFRGGLCKFADDESLPKITDILTKLAESNGARYKPAEFFDTNTQFYSG
jgi:3-hydroxyacyl-CoA dehydrogenase/enoyl-CoA hydratase/3-hydroxybutyryl-CoA epimerase